MSLEPLKAAAVGEICPCNLLSTQAMQICSEHLLFCLDTLGQSMSRMESICMFCMWQPQQASKTAPAKTPSHADACINMVLHTVKIAQPVVVGHASLGSTVKRVPPFARHQQAVTLAYCNCRTWSTSLWSCCHASSRHPVKSISGSRSHTATTLSSHAWR